MDEDEIDSDAATTHSIYIRAYNSENAFTLVIPKSMIVRESPSPRKAPAENAAWPPRSPRQVLLNSPSRRKRLQAAIQHEEPISPTKRRRLGDPNLDGQSASDEDDDEETVQLKLKAIEARLKLKKLQKAKRKIEDVAGEDSPRTGGKSAHGSGGIPRPPKVEVPLSPKPQRPNIQQPQSPRRVQLGIDKGLRADEVSLKKARLATQHSHESTGSHHKSFSARLAESRSRDASRREKEEQIQKRRSKGFGLSQVPKAEREGNKKPSSHSNRGKIPNERHDGARKFSTIGKQSNRTNLDNKNPKRLDETSESEQDQPNSASESNEPFSGFKLSKRKIEHPTLETALQQKQLISIRQLLKTVTAPHYDPPDVEDDYVVLGIIASKSLPRNHVAKHQTTTDAEPDRDTILPPKSKFMAIRLTDLRWEVDLFLFDTAFDRFWKLTVGTVVAILNPGIMPPKPHMRDTGQFSLKVVSSEDTILEVGMSADLGFCKSIKKDGKVCGQWIDGRKTDYCDFHVNLRVEKAKAGRMEINGMANLGMFGTNTRNGKRGGSHARGRGGSSGGKGRGGAGGGLTKEGAYYDRSVGETGYAIPKEFGGAINTSRMLDAEDYFQGGLSKAERSRKRLAEREKERDLAKALGNQGSGMGSEYMRLKRGDGEAKETSDKDKEQEERADAASLGLVGGSAQAITLSPSRKVGRAGRTSEAEPMGWGGAYKRGLLSPSRKLNGQPTMKPFLANDSKTREKEPSPSKQARFLIKEKGIRMPGRESNGRESRATFDADGDDGLDIIKGNF